MFYCQQGQDSTSKPPFIRGTDTVMERFSCFAARSGHRLTTRRTYNHTLLYFHTRGAVPHPPFHTYLNLW